MKPIIEYEFEKACKAIMSLDATVIESAANIIVNALEKGNQIFFMGNGGSSADAEHLAAELSGRYLFDRPALAGSSFSNIAPVTAIGNDYTYDNVFLRQTQALVRKGDVVVGLSTSGNSKNVILALEEASKKGARTIAFSGPHGKMKDIADLSVIINSDDTPHIQEGYMVAGHMMCCLIERSMFGISALIIDSSCVTDEEIDAIQIQYPDKKIVPVEFHITDGVFLTPKDALNKAIRLNHIDVTRSMFYCPNGRWSDIAIEFGLDPIMKEKS